MAETNAACCQQVSLAGDGTYDLVVRLREENAALKAEVRIRTP